jgi:aryl-alcohol dehydrogenase-like predicted oxidoreductase
VAKQFTRYLTAQQPQATARYLGIARAFGLSPEALALGFVYSRPFVTSSIIGATSLDQLKADIAASLTPLPEEALAAIADVYALYPDPCP